MLTLALAAVLILTATWSSANESETGLPFPQAIAYVEEAIEIAQSVPGRRVGLKLSRIRVDLKVGRVTTADGTAELGVPFIDVDIGAAAKRGATQLSVISVTLSPPPPKFVLEGSSGGGNALAEMIIDLRRQLADGMIYEPRLAPTSAEITIRFGITRERSAEGRFGFLIFSAGGALSKEDSQTSEIVLTFIQDIAP